MKRQRGTQSDETATETPGQQRQQLQQGLELGQGDAAQQPQPAMLLLLVSNCHPLLLPLRLQKATHRGSAHSARRQRPLPRMLMQRALRQSRRATAQSRLQLRVQPCLSLPSQANWSLSLRRHCWTRAA